ncbi:MAG: hypothetical protein WD737_08400 [Gemmatimonadota bacterium]
MRWVRYHFLSRTRRLLRFHERRGVAGATYMAVAYLLAFLLFPRPIAVLAMLYSALGDAAAALIGKRWGNHTTRWGKSWEGAAAGGLTSISVGMLMPGVPTSAALVGGIAAATLEFLPLRLNDNLRVVIGGGAAVWATAILAAPIG